VLNSIGAEKRDKEEKNEVLNVFVETIHAITCLASCLCYSFGFSPPLVLTKWFKIILQSHTLYPQVYRLCP
jgi:hypothetical protein